MSLSIEQLRERVAARFSDLEQVNDSVIKFTKMADNRPFAVYYLDIGENLPGTQESLTSYQDRVIGDYYFEGGQSLQWNNYLYFVTSEDRLVSNEARQAKELIERDRSYARKFVIPESDLDFVLSSPTVAHEAASPHANILSTWVELLTAANMGQAILSDNNLPKRLALVESPPRTSSRKSEAPSKTSEVKSPPFITALELKTFRPFPVQKKFEFGPVNLILGRHPSRKNSFFEALE